MTANEILNSVRIVSHCLDHEPVETLEAACQLVHDFFLQVTAKTNHSFDEAAEQRVVGSLWAEIEQAVARRQSERSSSNQKKG